MYACVYLRMAILSLDGNCLQYFNEILFNYKTEFLNLFYKVQFFIQFQNFK